MGFASVRRFAPALGAALLAGLLNACGGGGGGGDGSNPPPPVGGELEGRLWHTNYALDFLDGTQIARPEGSMPTTVTNDLPAWPWPDGSQYVVADVGGEYTDVTSYSTASGAVVNSVRFTGYMRGVKPSPVSKQVILATWSEDSVSPSAYIVYNLATLTVIDAFDTDDAVVDWLPDGRYLRISASGAITTAQPGQAAQANGSVSIPAGRELHNAWVNPQGTQMALQFIVRGISGSIEETDLWVAGANGSGLGRLTDTGISQYADWSPDGQRIAFNTDTGFACDGGCVGECSIWHVEPTARNVQALPSSNDAEHFVVKNSRGDDRRLGCELLAWTE